MTILFALEMKQGKLNASAKIAPDFNDELSFLYKGIAHTSHSPGEGNNN